MMPRCSPSIDANTAVVWRIDLGRFTGRYDEYIRLLNDSERTRANRFHSDLDHETFVFTRGSLRLILGAYLKVDPKLIRFAYNEFGKPFLVNKKERCDLLRFNISHSGHYALAAFSKFADVGVDIEFCREGVEHMEIAKRFFSQGEYESLAGLNASKRLNGFYCCWTRKEAYIKAVGKGLSVPLDSFEVSLGADELPKILRIEEGDPSNWKLFNIPLEERYLGALVTSATIERVEIIDFEEKEFI